MVKQTKEKSQSTPPTKHWQGFYSDGTMWLLQVDAGHPGSFASRGEAIDALEKFLRVQLVNDLEKLARMRTDPDLNVT